MIHDTSRILFTTDLSESSREVFEQTVALALKTSASITVLHVLESGPTQSRNTLVDLIGKDNYDKMKQANEDAARNALIGKQKEVPMIREALKNLSPDAFNQLESSENDAIIDSIEVISGHTAEVILQLAEEKQIDLIVMGHQRKSMLQKVVLGSAVRSVLKESKVPVYLVPINI